MPLHPAFTVDEVRRIAAKRRNLHHTVLVLAGLAGLVGVCAYIVGGWAGVAWGLAGGLIIAAVGPRVSPGLVLGAYGAVEIPFGGMPQVEEVLDVLARRAGLETPPRLYYLPVSPPLAFTVGSRDEPLLALSDGMLRLLPLRELAGVLAHEIAHVHSHDLRLMGIADTATRITRLMSLLGLLLLILNLPLWMAEGTQLVPWLLVAFLAFAPVIGSLLQLALSRTREYDADLDAAALTGDPEGLARALERLEYRHVPWWDRLLFPGRKDPDPSILRTHPPTAERIARLRALAAPLGEAGPLWEAEVIRLPDGLPRVVIRRRRSPW